MGLSQKEPQKAAAGVAMAIPLQRVDVKAILRDPKQRAEMIAGAVRFLIALEDGERHRNE